LKTQDENDFGKNVGKALAGAAFGVLVLFYSLNDGAPPLDALTIESGTLHSFEEVRSGSRGNKTPRFMLGPSNNVFQYVSKAGEISAVSSALRGASGKTVEVYFDAADPFSPPLDDIDLFTIYALSIEGVEIRKYDEVAAAWKDDSNIGVSVGILIIVVCVSIGAALVWDKRSDS
jgi:hypothetical protein